MLGSNEEAYVLGLWCADGYHRTSSIGLSNTNLNLIFRFRKYLLNEFSEERLRLRIYVPTRYSGSLPSDVDSICGKISYLKVRKASRISYHIYVNSRPLLRRFKVLKASLENMAKDRIVPYLAGRFDGDGSAGSDCRSDVRIVYGNIQEAKVDQMLMNKVNSYKTSIYCYRTARTYCLYVSRHDARKFLHDIRRFSNAKNLLPCRD